MTRLLPSHRRGQGPLSDGAATTPEPGLPGTGPFRADVCWQDGCAIVTLTGELDLATAPVLASELAPVLARQPQRLILDLAGLCFIDCSGLSEFIRASRALPAGRRLTLRSASPATRKLLAMSGLQESFELQD
jgi:anti-sigma B factor antagonist